MMSPEVKILSVLNQAYYLGRLAAKDGRKRAPVACPVFMRVLEQHIKGENVISASDLCTEFLHGYQSYCDEQAEKILSG